MVRARFSARTTGKSKRLTSHPGGVSRIPRTPSGVRMLITFLPGVRKKRVPLAKFPAPLRGAFHLVFSRRSQSAVNDDHVQWRSARLQPQTQLCQAVKE